MRGPLYLPFPRTTSGCAAAAQSAAVMTSYYAVQLLPDQVCALMRLRSTLPHPSSTPQSQMTAPVPMAAQHTLPYPIRPFPHSQNVTTPVVANAAVTDLLRGRLGWDGLVICDCA